MDMPAEFVASILEDEPANGINDVCSGPLNAITHVLSTRFPLLNHRCYKPTGHCYAEKTEPTKQTTYEQLNVHAMYENNPYTGASSTTPTGASDACEGRAATASCRTHISKAPSRRPGASH